MTDNEKRLREFVNETAPKLREALQEAIRRTSPMDDPETKERMESVIESIGPSPAFEQVELTRELVSLVKGKGADTKRKKSKPTPAETYAFNLYNHGVELWRQSAPEPDAKPTSKDVYEVLRRKHSSEQASPDPCSVFNAKYGNSGLPSRETLRTNASRYRYKMNLPTLNEQ